MAKAKDEGHEVLLLLLLLLLRLRPLATAAAGWSWSAGAVALVALVVGCWALLFICALLMSGTKN